MNKSYVIAAAAILLVGIAAVVYLISNQSTQNQQRIANVPVTTPLPSAVDQGQSRNELPISFDNIKTPHFVSSIPANNAVLTKGPPQVTINFNFNLTSGSKIAVTADGNDVTTAQGTKISSDKRSMNALINPVEPATYKVNYTACWPDGSCHEGSFGFSVKSQ